MFSGETQEGVEFVVIKCGLNPLIPLTELGVGQRQCHLSIIVRRGLDGANLSRANRAEGGGGCLTDTMECWQDHVGDTAELPKGES